ncbi:putative protein-disulfide isomerase [Daejeonella rubra]|uniref:DSBA-like thioredoxin domain-containing protein n=1 Tax=Daejeonella rubra TaxID=990371 RepID=A0A1G9W3I9_9SPHI|nr:DsbA family protein [Daejeonella rubra]SDM79104.1 putative protein-disulfide isomerase [Daejeonella rubra]
MNKPLRIIYVYDALCGWCYGFSQVIMECFDKHKDDFEFEVLSGGMMIGDKVGSINKIAPFIKSAYHSIERTTGIKFGEPYLRHLEEGAMILDSEKPSIALSVFKLYLPDLSVPFVHDLQNAIYFDGKNPNDYDLYRYLAVNFGIDPDEFEAKMNLDTSKEAAYYDFALVKQLRVESFPAVLIQTSDTGFYLIAKGFTDSDTLELRISNVLKEIKESEN